MQWDISFPTCAEQALNVLSILFLQALDILVLVSQLSVTEVIQLCKGLPQLISGGKVQFSPEAPIIFIGPLNSLYLAVDESRLDSGTM